MVKTGNFGYIQYDFENTFNNSCGVCLGAGAKVFGLEQSINGWTWTNNRINLSQMNSVELKGFAYGQSRGNLSVDFVISNPWYNSLFFDRTACCFPAVCTGVETFTWETTCNAGTKDVESFAMEIGIEQGACDTVRTLRGAVANSLTMRSSVGETIKGSLDIQYASDTKSTSADATPASETIGTGCSQYTPFTFAHGSIQLNCCTVAELQSFDVTLNQNSDLLWGHGSNAAVGAYRRIFEMTGTFQASWTDFTLLNTLYAQVNDNSVALDDEQTNIILTFDNGLSSTNQRQITYTFTGIGVADQSTSIQPGEPIFENLNWQARRCAVTAVTNDTAEP